jgi:hypothetical protein
MNNDFLIVYKDNGGWMLNECLLNIMLSLVVSKSPLLCMCTLVCEFYIMTNCMVFWVSFSIVLRIWCLFC